MPEHRVTGRLLTPYARSLIRKKARQLCRRPGFCQTDKEDLVQDLTLKLLEKEHLFDPSRASADTFADRIIRSGVAMILRHRKRRVRADGFAAVSLSTEVLDADGRTITLRDVMTEADNRRRLGTTPRDPDLERDVAEAMELLPPDLRLLAETLKEDRPAHAAKKLGLSRSTVYDRVKQIRKRFECAGFGTQRT